jgi:hypothetical protein
VTAAVVVQEEFAELCFNVTRSIRYHDARREFFDMAQKLVSWIALIASSGAFVAVLQREVTLSLYLSALVAVISALTVVFEFSSKLATYTDLRNRYVDLEAMLAACRNPTEDDLIRLTKMRKDIERGEPSVSHSLNLICYNDAIDALGRDPSHKVNVSWLQRVRAYTYLG